jgi:hypothetical protein
VLGSREILPGFWMQTFGGIARHAQDILNERIELSGRMHPGTEAFEILAAMRFVTASAKMLRAVLRLDRKRTL